VNATLQVAEGMKAAGALTLLTKESAAESLYQTIKQAAGVAKDLSSRLEQEWLPFSVEFPGITSDQPIDT
jgi:hypothetical protein